MAVKKKKSPTKLTGKPVPGKKRLYSRTKSLAIGIDISTYSVSLAGIATTREGKIRAGAISRRWERGTDYFERMKEVSRAHDLVHELLMKMHLSAELEEIHIAIEEAVPFGRMRAGQSQAMKQQLQLSGSLIGGLLRYGYAYLYEIQWQQWAKLVAQDLGLTTHHTKWNPDKRIGKYRAQQWVEQFHPKWDGHWPDLVTHSKRGLIPRGDSKAKGAQSDDRYEALGIAWWMRQELKSQ